MDRRLILMRHAKSSWKSDAATDHARPLNARGRRDAQRVAARLTEIGWTPELVLSSDAERTRETLALMLGAFAVEPKIELSPRLYLAGIQELASALGLVSDAVRSVLLLGHNPGWDEALSWLSGAKDELKTANAALLEGRGVNWADSVKAPRQYTLRTIIRPREL